MTFLRVIPDRLIRESGHFGSELTGFLVSTIAHGKIVFIDPTRYLLRQTFQLQGKFLLITADL